MITEKMTITKALSELKTLDKRIDSEIRSSKFCDAIKHFQKTLDGKPINEVKKDMQAQFDKINSLINRRNAIKQQVTAANATTMITIDGVSMSVAEAIYYKTNGITQRKQLLNTLVFQYNNALKVLESQNGDRLSTMCDNYISNTFGIDKGADKSNSEDIIAARQNYMESNTYDLIEGVDIKTSIDTLKSQIDNFEAEVDAAITIANATTEIIIEY